MDTLVLARNCLSEEAIASSRDLLSVHQLDSEVRAGGSLSTPDQKRMVMTFKAFSLSRNSLIDVGRLICFSFSSSECFSDWRLTMRR